MCAIELRRGVDVVTDDLRHLLEGFESFAENEKRLLEHRHLVEKQRLETAIHESKDETVKLALKQSLVNNAMDLYEPKSAYDEVVSVATKMEGYIGTTSVCKHIQCGSFASCIATEHGPACVCNEGYVGTGTSCHAPPEFMPHRLIPTSHDHQSIARDLAVSVLSADKISVVFRDKSLNNAGQLILGTVHGGLLELGPTEVFTARSAKAFDPVIVGTDKRIAIAWRDEDRNGHCWMRGGTLGSHIRGSEMALTLGAAITVCNDQSHKMAMISLPGERVALVFAEKSVTDTGKAILGEIDRKGSIQAMGSFRFSDFPLCRLEVTKVSPTAFIVGARAGAAFNDVNLTSQDQQALAIYGEMVDNLLVFDPNVANIDSGTVWARGVSLIAPNTIAYAYQTTEHLKQAVLRIDEHHRMKVTDRQVLHTGVSPYVKMLSVPYTPADPHTLVYYDDGQRSVATICSWRQKLEHCEESVWLALRPVSVAGATLGGGRSLMVFATEDGRPFYAVFGLSRK